MPRSRRPLVENGIYHVFNRGISRKNIQLNKIHSAIFFDSLARAVEKYRVKVFSYCLMQNHYHLMIQTPNANLDKFMQFFSSRLAISINHALGGDGALFRSRYRAILVEEETYLYQLFRYIHLNPVKGNLVPDPLLYKLSSFQYYLNAAKSPKWLDTQPMSEKFPSNKALIEYHEGNNSPLLDQFYEKKRLPSVLNKKTIMGKY